jgi:hypothetical protein
MSVTCRDCSCSEGELHELYCLVERCPFCGGQLASCRCIVTVLELSENEIAALDAYEDDSVEPLSGIVARWEKALRRKGRVPFLTAS